MKLSIVILAAGLGKRMYSDLPKVLHLLAGQPLLKHVVMTASTLGPEQIYGVHGHGGDQVKQALSDQTIRWVEQIPQLGTGHAVAQVIPYIADDHQVLILYGDVPLIRSETLQQLITRTPEQSLGLLTVELANPKGYGRILRDSQGRVQRIVEDKDADSTLQQIKEVNTGILVAPANALRRWLTQLKNDNVQGEYYLTDIIALSVAEGSTISTYSPAAIEEVLGVNDRLQLATLERYYQIQQTYRLMQQGVTVRDPTRLDIRGTLQVGRDVVIDVNVIFEGQVVLGDRVTIGPHTIIRNTQIANEVEILSHCVIEEAKIGARCRIGPFARIRPETQLAEHVHIGNFVEIKKSTIATDSKINHLSYIGDSEVGSRVNIGAGTITCNYDGANKHRTIIGDDVFIGSDTQLVAPVTVYSGATIGAGSTITKNAPANLLTLSRTKQQTVLGWQRPSKKKG